MSRMKRLILTGMITAALAVGGAVPVFADVHGVSQAGCAPTGVSSGASVQASRDATGRPDAPIPVTASGGKTEGEGGSAPAMGENC